MDDDDNDDDDVMIMMMIFKLKKTHLIPKLLCKLI